MAVGVVYTIKDAKGARSQTRFNFKLGLSITDYVLNAEGLTTLVGNLIKGRIENVGLVVDVPFTPGGAADADSDVEEGARFQLQTETRISRPHVSQRLTKPSFNRALPLWT